MRKVVRALLLSGALIAVAGLVGPPFAAGQAKKDKDTSVFEVKKGKNDLYYFSLRDSEGVLLALSGKGYETKADCQKVIETIRTTAAKAKVEFKAASTEDKKTATEDKKKKK